MKNYIVFKYYINKLFNLKPYIEAYPLNNRPLEFLNELITELNTRNCIIITETNRNQARKRGYEWFIDSTGKGFNNLPYSYRKELFDAYKRRNSNS